MPGEEKRKKDMTYGTRTGNIETRLAAINPAVCPVARLFHLGKIKESGQIFETLPNFD